MGKFGCVGHTPHATGVDVRGRPRATAGTGLDYPEGVFSRNKAPADTPAPESTKLAELSVDTSAGKGRPTPKRKVAEAANKRPLVPADRKAAAREARVKQRELRDRQYQAMQSGDERFMPVRDKGPVKRYIRAYIDARWNVAEFVLPLFIVIFASTMLISRWSPAIGAMMLLASYLLIIVAAIDAAVSWRRLKARLTAKFGQAPPRGSAWYAIIRSFQLRRLRMPKPMEAKHGVYPS